MKILYFDCFCGISGDMTLGALINLGVNQEYLINELRKLDLDGWDIKFNKCIKNGITAVAVEVILDTYNHHSHKHEHNHTHRNLKDINIIIDNSKITDKAKLISKAIFLRLAKAEAKIHDSTPEEVHFHEVGAVDSIIDIVGTAICLDILSPDVIYSSIIQDGHGFVNCQHGIIPIPVPATMEVLNSANAILRQIDIEGELVTPTGAAIISEISKSYGNPPAFKAIATGYGAGKKDFKIPNVLRVTMGEIETKIDDNITVIETNIDDSTPEILGYTVEKLLENGAKDAFLIPICMKKNRLASMLTVICENKDISKMENIIFSETSTLGLRKYNVNRTCLSYSFDTIDTLYGKLDVKISEYNNIKRIYPEYESAKKLAEENKIPILNIYNKVL